MKLLKKLILIVAAALVVLIPLGITFTIGWRPFIGPRVRAVTDRKFESTPVRLERGTYLVNSVAGCFGCHSEPDPSLPGAPPKAGREGAGAFLGTDPQIGDFITPNITPDKETGIGSWTDDEIARAVREGISRNGKMLFPAMPYENFRHMSDEDIASVVVYLRSIPAVSNKARRMEIPFPLNRLVMSAPQPITEPVAEPDKSTPRSRGTYIVTLASCADCHTPRDAQGQVLPNLNFAGGSPVHSPTGKMVTALNLTPDPSGIPYYDEEIFIKTIRTGQIGARKLDPAMPWGFFRHMTDDDLKSVWAFIHNLKPVVHHVDNTVEPTMCPLCGSSHGLGKTNKK
jgi:mono/diheme cytochrome c family protein